MSLLDYVLNHARSTGLIPDDAQVFIDGVEFTGTGDELLDALGYVHAQVKVTVRLRPTAEFVNVTISVPTNQEER